MKYKFGVMSNVWELEAKNDNIAFVTMCMFIGKNVPIAIYSPYKKAIQPSIIMDLDNPQQFIIDNKKDLIKAKDSIKHKTTK